MTFRLHRLASCAALAALMLTPIAGSGLAGTGEIGVTAAVNPQVTGTPPGQPPRTLTLGNAVYHNERIRTEADGLLQVLFIDGTTFTVGPGTELVIDSYVFDPTTGTGKIAATMAKGVLRFVGGKISKTPNAVEINTLSGTIGIRGAVVNIDARSRNAGKIMFEFGRSANFCSDGRCMKLFQQGWLFETGPDFPQGRIRKTEPSDITLIQQALAGRRGKQGGAPQRPTGQQVQQSNVASVETTPTETQPQTGGLKPVGDGLTLEDIPGLLNPIADIATDSIAGGNEPPEPPETEREALAAGIITSEETGTAPVFNLPGTVKVSGDRITGGSFFTPIVGSEDAFAAQFTFGPTANPSVATATSITVFDSGGQPVATDQPTAGQLTLNTTPICQSCSFLSWGGWSATVTTEATGTTEGQGLWVAGTPIPEAQLPTTGVATYQGSAHATVNNLGQQYQASGSLQMSWNFAQRAGDMTISSFDTANVAGGLTFSGAIDNQLDAGGFAGSLLDSENGVGAFVSGGFASGGGGGGLPQGVAGTWNTFSEGYMASGVFGGALGPPSATGR